MLRTSFSRISARPQHRPRLARMPGSPGRAQIVQIRASFLSARHGRDVRYSSCAGRFRHDTATRTGAVLFTYELARRLQATLVTANALHPGVVRTSFGAEDPGGVQRLLIPFVRPFMKAPGRGAATSIHLVSAPDLEQVTGRYFASSKPRRSSRGSYDQAAAARLWQVSADLTGLTAVGAATSAGPAGRTS
jgi:NAD(P)-dependent dehydrogenase (short-subunit alcohol dehydrogenase family)